jgi:putative ABC transport system substrate-binding protein
MPVVGFLHGGSPDGAAPHVAAFHAGLKRTGHVESRNVALEFRWAEGDYDRLPALAAELANRRPAVIAATGGVMSALAAKAATQTVPIVFLIGDDPVMFGLVESFNRPGRNVTGVTFLSPALEGKRIDLLHELVPGAGTIGVLMNPKSSGVEVRLRDVREAARRLGLQLSIVNAVDEDEFELAFATLLQRSVGALIVTSDPFFNARRNQLIALAARHRMPAIYFDREFAAAGGLISYGTSLFDSYRQLGVYTGQVLKGVKPADLPVVQPTRFELVINLKTAKALDLDMPAKLLALADDVIE